MEWVDVVESREAGYDVVQLFGKLLGRELDLPGL